MLPTSEDVVEAKTKVSEALGPDVSKKYFRILRSWFRGETNKDDFDQSARALFTSDTVHLHNLFLLSLFSKCSISFGSISHRSQRLRKKAAVVSRIKASASSPNLAQESRFYPADPFTYIPSVPASSLPPLSPQDSSNVAFEGLQSCSRDGHLPEPGLVQSRALLIAWEADLSQVDDGVIQLVLVAARELLKNILTAMIKLRKGYTNRDGRFAHKFGYSDMSSHNVSHKKQSDQNLVPSVHNRVMGANVEMRQSEVNYTSLTLPSTPIGLTDLIHALQEEPEKLIPIHSLCSRVIERALCNIYQPNQDELEGILMAERRLRGKRSGSDTDLGPVKKEIRDEAKVKIESQTVFSIDIVKTEVITD